jgi:putative lipoprotein
MMITGQVIFNKDTPVFKSAVMYVRLENVTFADAPSKTVSEYIEQNVSYDAHSSNTLQFKLQAECSDPSETFAIRVHIDLDCDGKVSRGDYITMRSYPIRNTTNSTHQSIVVNRVV